MKELVEVIAKALVEKPEAVQVTEESDGKHVTVKLKVDPADMGKVIGKQGRIAKAIRASSGGFKACRAMGFTLEDRGTTQVSMNMVN